MKEQLRRALPYIGIITFASLFAIVPALNRTKIEGDHLTFRLPNLDGIEMAQDDPEFSDTVLLVNIWGTWCPPCRVEIPYLSALKEKYGDRGFEIIGIEYPAYSWNSEKERRQLLQGFSDEVGINYRILLGTHPESVMDDLPNLRNFKGFPTSIFVDRNGKVVHTQQGFYEGDIPRYEALIESLLEEAPTN
ncbi:MAG: TlpA disulfide reductase family protein [Candidatus Hydrogenedentota bacterium]